MKKSTILVILIVYLASIVIISFFGMRVKVYDEIKYVKSIEMSAEAENENMFTFRYIGIDPSSKNRLYQLDVHFDEALTGTFERASGIIEERRYVPLILMPKVIYDTGDVANMEEEGIKYSVSNESFFAKEYISLSAVGALICFRTSIAFVIYVNPSTRSGNGTGAIIHVYII